MIVILIELSPSFEFVQATKKLYQNPNCVVILLKYAIFQQFKALR